jgi:hypothetical protein
MDTPEHTAGRQAAVGLPSDTRLSTAPGTRGCRNCGARLLGRYCVDCGQAADVHVPSTRELVHEALEGLTHSDSRLWRTLTCLWFKPGELTRAFVEGRRMAYLPPIRLYLVVSVIFFLIASVSHSSLRVMTLHDGNVSVSNVEASCSRLDLTSHWKQRIERACIKVVSDHGASLVHLAAATMPKAMFVFLPLIAFLHMLMYWRPRHRYAEHLLFFVHLHAFIFSVAILYWLARDGADIWPTLRASFDLLSKLMFGAVVAYTIIAMRRVFRRAWLNLAIKTLLLCTIYTALLAVTVTGVFVYAALQL